MKSALTLFEPVVLRQAALAMRWAAQPSLTADGIARASMAAGRELTVKMSPGRHFMYSEDGQTRRAFLRRCTNKRTLLAMGLLYVELLICFVRNAMKLNTVISA
jgi:hypothetical protein